MRSSRVIVLVLVPIAFGLSGCGQQEVAAIGAVAAAILGPAQASAAVLQPSTTPITGSLPTSFVPTLTSSTGTLTGGTVAQPTSTGTTTQTGTTSTSSTTLPSDRKALIDQALQLAGVAVTQENEDAVNTIVEHESNWDPKAINNTDSNAQKGDPSRGLMQTIGATFRENALPGYDTDIYDPLSNLIAGIRYAVRRYGSLQNVPGVRSLANGGPYLPY